MEINKNLDLLEKLKQTNLLPLAFLGDSVHTLFVREKMLYGREGKMENYHTKASCYCKASKQAQVLKSLLPYLTDEEETIVRRGRNAKPKHSAKNSSSADYSLATAFEILIGYLYLKGDKERLEEVLELSIKDWQLISKKVKWNFKRGLYVYWR